MNRAVWIELPDEHDQADVDKLNEGLLLWEASGTVDTAVVTTTAEKDQSFAKIKSNLTVVPMIRTWPSFGWNPDSYDGWGKVADAVEEHTKTPIVGLDNETLVKPYVKGEMAVDLAGFLRAVSQLPCRTYLWYTSVESTNQFAAARQAAMCACMAAVHTTIWVDRSFDRPSKALAEPM